MATRELLIPSQRLRPDALPVDLYERLMACSGTWGAPCGPSRLGELRDRSYEDQQDRASGLTLLTAAIGHWNAVYLGRVVAALRARGEEYLAHLSPLEWEHITLTSVHRWDLGEEHGAPGRPRPLRKLRSAPV